MQVGFITNLRKILEKGEDRALLISATGTGKTYASAFAMRELGFRQVKASNANYWVVVERTTEEVQHLLPAEAEQANPPGEKPSEENTELPF